jgi:trehalose 6-phosphate synthase/phosphatase
MSTLCNRERTAFLRNQVHSPLSPSRGAEFRTLPVSDSRRFRAFDPNCRGHIAVAGPLQAFCPDYLFYLSLPHMDPPSARLQRDDAMLRKQTRDRIDGKSIDANTDEETEDDSGIDDNSNTRTIERGHTFERVADGDDDSPGDDDDNDRGGKGSAVDHKRPRRPSSPRRDAASSRRGRPTASVGTPSTVAGFAVAGSASGFSSASLGAVLGESGANVHDSGCNDVNLISMDQLPPATAAPSGAAGADDPTSFLRSASEKSSRSAEGRARAKDDRRVSEEEILAQIHRLHLELESVRDSQYADGDGESSGAYGADPGDQTAGGPDHHSHTGMRTPRLIVVANRLPFTMSKDRMSGEWALQVSSGGLVSALAGVKNKIPFLWVGWTGVEVPSADHEPLRKRFLEEMNCYPVFLSDHDANYYYNGFCNDVLWPLFHYVPLPIMSSDGERKFDFKYWDAYSRANHRFAEAVMQVYQPGDLVWVQDYHLMLLPSLLRKRLRNVTIGFFLHTPFPSSEVYRILPVRDELLKGVLAADLIGFHTYDYARHFLSVCTRIIGLEASPKGVMYKNRFAHVGIFPIGIDPEVFEKSLASDVVKDGIAKLASKFKGKKVLLGVDRLDYIKGVPHKLMAFETLLARHPEWKGKIVLVQIAVPSRTEVEQYKKLITQTNALVGRINGKYSSVEYSPIVFINQSVKHDDLVALYALADVAVITSIRDGMNLVSYEYVMCQRERHGVLVLSEFAGSAQSLSSAIRVNPWNIEELASALHEALSVPDRERELKHWKLYHYVTKHTAAFWAQSFVGELQQVEAAHYQLELNKMQQSVLRVSVDVLPEMRSRNRRLFLLDYEGTLSAPSSLPDMAVPSSAIRRNLQKLSFDTRNSVYIMSGRSKIVLDSWFGDLPVGLVAEHGCDFRHPRHPAWEPLVGMHDSAWRDSVIRILQYFCERTPGAYLELKEKIITWHFRDADPMFGSWQAKELQLHLAESCMNLPVEVVSGPKYLELRPVGVTRVAAVQRILAELPEPSADYIFALGSDKGDEDVFAYVSQFVRRELSVDGSCIAMCCRVGEVTDVSAADRYVSDVEAAQRVLKELALASSSTSSAKKGGPGDAPSSGLNFRGKRILAGTQGASTIFGGDEFAVSHGGRGRSGGGSSAVPIARRLASLRNSNVHRSVSYDASLDRGGVDPTLSQQGGPYVRDAFDGTGFVTPPGVSSLLAQSALSVSSQQRSHENSSLDGVLEASGSSNSSKIPSREPIQQLRRSDESSSDMRS